MLAPLKRKSVNQLFRAHLGPIIHLPVANPEESINLVLGRPPYLPMTGTTEYFLTLKFATPLFERGRMRSPVYLCISYLAREQFMNI